MKNNNGAIIRRLTGRSLKSNKKRNFFITTAIALTMLLIASVFSIGMSLMESMKMQETRLWATAHAAITQPTASQMEQLNRLNYVKAAGTGNNVAFVKITPQMGDMNLSLHYFDKTEWEKLRSPDFTDIVGSYPQKENEIMVPLWVLERLGHRKPVNRHGDTLSYYTESGDNGALVNEIFNLSGWFTSYMYIRSGNIDSL